MTSLKRPAFIVYAVYVLGVPILILALCHFLKPDLKTEIKRDRAEIEANRKTLAAIDASNRAAMDVLWIHAEQGEHKDFSK